MIKTMGPLPSTKNLTEVSAVFYSLTSLPLCPTPRHSATIHLFKLIFFSILDISFLSLCVWRHKDILHFVKNDLKVHPCYVAHVCILFLFIAEYILAVYLYHTGFPRSPVDSLPSATVQGSAAPHASSAKQEGPEPGDSRMRVSVPPHSRQQQLILPF